MRQPSPARIFHSGMEIFCTKDQDSTPKKLRACAAGFRPLIFGPRKPHQNWRAYTSIGDAVMVPSRCCRAQSFRARQGVSSPSCRGCRHPSDTLSIYISPSIQAGCFANSSQLCSVVCLFAFQGEANRHSAESCGSMQQEQFSSAVRSCRDGKRAV